MTLVVPVARRPTLVTVRFRRRLHVSVSDPCTGRPAPVRVELIQGYEISKFKISHFKTLKFAHQAHLGLRAMAV